jgi:hypothetical protein
VNVLLFAVVGIGTIILMQMAERRDRNPVGVIAGMAVIVFWVAVAAEHFGWALQ